VPGAGIILMIVFIPITLVGAASWRVGQCWAVLCWLAGWFFKPLLCLLLVSWAGWWLTKGALPAA
jgi:hypothetical protein